MKRQPGIDLVRITGVFFVVALHQFLYNGFYYEAQTGFLIWAADSFRWLFFCCNGIFMMLTGYLKSMKPVGKGYYKGLVPILISYVLCCIIIFPIQSQLISPIPFTDWLDKLVGFGNYAWYIEMYIGLILFSPFINLALERVKERKHLLILAGVMVFTTSLASATPLNLVPDYWTSLYPVTYYVLGAVIQRIQPKVKFWQGMGAAMLISMGLALATILTTDEGFYKGFSQGYGGFWVMAITTCVFLSLYRAQAGPRASKVLAWMAGGCYEGFMLSLLPDLWAYKLVREWHEPKAYPLVFLCVTIPIFIFSILAGKLVHTLAEQITKRLPGFAPKKKAVGKTK